MSTVVLQTKRLILRNWEEKDREAFHRLNHDEQVMAFFPFRRNREESDAAMDDMTGRFKRQGYCFGAVELKATGETIGVCGINPTDLLSQYANGTVEIGWRFLPEFWHQGFATEAAIAWRDYAFASLDLPELVAFAVATNHPSHRVMERIGMTEVPQMAFDHPHVPEDQPHLSPHSVHQILRKEWEGLGK